MFITFRSTNRLHTHTRKAASLDEAIYMIRQLARRRTSPFPVAVIDADGSTLVEFKDRDDFRKALRA